MGKFKTSNKNSKKTMNVRTHNPFEVYKHDEKTLSNENNPNDNLNEELSAEFDAKVKNKNNATNHKKDQQSNRKK
ncbi:hypothetical protein ACFOZY_00580 [Chungangia koreensis]|uniref:Uncharacterized protein n=1 Tax=Chungangia koreensis TaxID=752657 RepID=A0ABV8X4C6_9LACT